MRIETMKELEAMRKAKQEKVSEKKRKYQKKYRLLNADILRIKAKKRYLRNKEKILARVMKRYWLKLDEIHKKRKIFYRKNGERFCEYARNYRRSKL
jgi:hypothetical protein